MELINYFLAGIIDKFKANSPSVALFLMALFGTAVYWLGTDYAVSVLGDTAATLSKYVALVLGLLQGSRTTQILKPPQVYKK